MLAVHKKNSYEYDRKSASSVSSWHQIVTSTDNRKHPEIKQYTAAVDGNTKQSLASVAGADSTKLPKLECILA